MQFVFKKLEEFRFLHFKYLVDLVDLVDFKYLVVHFCVTSPYINYSNVLKLWCEK